MGKYLFSANTIRNQNWLLYIFVNLYMCLLLGSYTCAYAVRVWDVGNCMASPIGWGEQGMDREPWQEDIRNLSLMNSPPWGVVYVHVC